MAYHTSPDGVVRRCNPKQTGKCKFGSDTPHFETKVEAEKHNEKVLSQEYGTFNTLNKDSEATLAGFQDVSEKRTIRSDLPEDLDEFAELSAKNLEHLSDDQKKAISGYSGFAAGVCNRILRGNEYLYYDDAPLWKETRSGPTDFYTREDLVDYMETMDEILSPRKEEPRILYRGIPVVRSIHTDMEEKLGRKIDPEDADALAEGLKEQYKVGQIIKHDNYLSTSVDPEIAAERTQETSGTLNDYRTRTPKKGIMMELKTNAGVDITGALMSHYQYERETLLPRETYFKIANVEIFPESYESTENKYKDVAAVLQMVEVDKDGNEINATKHVPERKIEDIVAQEEKYL